VASQVVHASHGDDDDDDEPSLAIKWCFAMVDYSQDDHFFV
jgi:hypothetical protein